VEADTEQQKLADQETPHQQVPHKEIMGEVELGRTLHRGEVVEQGVVEVHLPLAQMEQIRLLVMAVLEQHHLFLALQ
jgi:hypothetical protein